MGFRQADSEGRGGFARIWSIEDKGNYSIAKISTSKKRRDGDGYETDFQDGFVRLIGSAHEKAKNIDIPVNADGMPVGVAIQITLCEVTTPYNQETKKGYVNYAIFAFNIPDGDGSGSSATAKGGKKSTAKASKASKAKAAPVDDAQDDSEDLPF